VAYALLADVKARAGALSGSWDAATKPSDGDITGFLGNISDEINAIIAARGLSLPVAGSAAALALAGMNTDGALILALEATFPEGSGPSSAGKTLDDARDRYKESYDQLVAGTLPALALLESGASAPSASSFWQQEGDSFGTLSTPDARDANPFTSAGPVGRGQRF
jgi:predicted RNase H-like HicB family nuclease